MAFRQSSILTQRDHRLETIDRNNYKTHAGNSSTRQMRGYNPRDFDTNPFAGTFQRFSRSLIPRSEWKERIEYKEKTESHLYHRFKAKEVPVLSQKRLPYCWCYGTVGAMSMVRAVNNLPTLKLSATSAASKIKNYREQGGWAEEAIEGIQRFGVSTIDYWPEAVNNRKYDTQEQRENAALHKFGEVEELPSKNFDAIVSSLLYGFPVTLGLMWWGHLVYAIDALWDNGAVKLLIVNSWDYSWGDNGMGTLDENRGTAHEAFSIQSITHSLV